MLGVIRKAVVRVGPGELPGLEVVSPVKPAVVAEKLAVMFDFDLVGAQAIFIRQLGGFFSELQRQMGGRLLEQLLAAFGRQAEDDEFWMLVGLP